MNWHEIDLKNRPIHWARGVRFLIWGCNRRDGEYEVLIAEYDDRDGKLMALNEQTGGFDPISLATHWMLLPISPEREEIFRKQVGVYRMRNP